MAKAKLEKQEKVEITGNWRDYLRLESYLFSGITDRGHDETINVETQKPSDMDDLAIAIELGGGGPHILLPSNSRIVIEEDGSLVIQLY